MDSYDELRETYLPAEEIAAIVAAGCPAVERGKDPAYYLMALVTKHVAAEIKPIVDGHLDASYTAELIDVVADLLGTMLLIQSEITARKFCAVSSIS